MRHVGSILAAATVGAFTLACVGGAATGEQDFGNPEGGVWLAGEDATGGAIAVAAGGRFIAWRHEPEGGAARLAIGFPDDGETVLTSIVEPLRLVFAHDAPIVYVVHDEGSGGVTAYDIDQGVMWEVPLPAVDVVAEMDISGDDRHLVLHHGHQAVVLDAHTGETRHALSFERPLIDADILPDEARIAFVEQEVWADDAPEARISVLHIDEGGTVATFGVPNCGARLEVVPSTMRGFLAPTFCTQDPVSVLSLAPGEERFERNLPGFGPVSIAPDGATVVAFYDHQQADPSLFDDPDQIPGDDAARYHLMRIDSEALTFELLPYGEALPRYSIDRAGSVVLVDSVWPATPLRLLDLDGRSFRKVVGAKLSLDRFSYAPNGKVAHVLQAATAFDGETPAGLYTVDLATGHAWSQPVPFVPTSLNVSPDGRTLFLRHDDTEVCVWDLPTSRCGRTIELGSIAM